VYDGYNMFLMNSYEVETDYRACIIDLLKLNVYKVFSSVFEMLNEVK